MNMCKKIFVVSVAFLEFLGTAYADELQDKCKEIYRKNPPEVNITYNYGKLKFDNSKTTEELDELYNEINPGENAKNIHGLTHLSPQEVTVVTTNSQMISADKLCFYPGKIEINIWYDPVIFIAKSLEIGSCRFNVTLRHEQTHLDLGHHALYLFAKSLKGAVPHILSQVSPIVEDMKTADAPKITQNMTETYQNLVKMYFEKFKNWQQKYNGMIDTLENYAAESKLCPTD